ncbi:MAG: D-glycero-beta-D-manno-heptose 1-phosphate adenylyltransferase [Caulobacteraceae bacterium]
MELLALQQLLSAVAGARVLTVGDLMVDRFVHGEVSRVSAEAPIPILARTHENVMLGAAGNVARNVAALGGAASLVGVVGDDAPAHEATDLIGREGGIEGFLITDPGRSTTVKTRFVGAGQQLLRLDFETVAPVVGEVEQRLVRTVRDAAKGAGVILLSDYGKGVATAAVISACLAVAKARGATLIVDSKACGFARYGAADVVKPNAAELGRATDLPTGSDAEIEIALAKALELSRCRSILVTRSAKGMSLAVRGGAVRHFRRPPAEVFDASGAGDTALAALGVALAAGADLEPAIHLALLASSVAVEKAGTATVTPYELVEAELAAHRAPAEAKIAGATRTVKDVTRWRANGMKIGFTNGCFDILHPGHIAYLSEARGWCDRLIVGLNTDRSVRANKGPGRPVNPLEARAMVLAGLACVDLVAPFDEDTPEALIAAVRPDILIKGGDYADQGVVGHDIVTAYGGEVRLAAFVEGHSTTATLRRVSGRA